MSRLLTIMMVIFGLALIAPQVTLAANGVTDAATDPIKLNPEVKIPGLYDTEQTIDDNGIATYIRAIYIYFIWAVGILAVVMITYGGIRWVAAAGNPGRINDARETINNAIIGLIIALTSYALLYIINPQLLNLTLPKTITSIPTKYYSGLAVVDFCDPSKETSTQCGDIQELGIAYDSQHKQQKTYCISTRCLKSVRTPTVCSIQTTTVPPDQQLQPNPKVDYKYVNYFAPDRGCTDQIPVLTTLSSFGTNPTLHANELFACGNARDTTGDVDTRLTAGIDCNESYTDKYRSCYVLKLPAQLIPRSGTAYRVDQMQCKTS